MTSFRTSDGAERDLAVARREGSLTPKDPVMETARISWERPSCSRLDQSRLREGCHVDPAALLSVRTRRLDGAATWKYLD